MWRRGFARQERLRHGRPRERFSVDNDEEGHKQLRKRLTKLRPERIVLEPTGGYEAAIVEALISAKLPMVVVNARQVRNFAQAIGRLAKTDGIDADVLAQFGEAIRPEIRPFPDNELRELEALVTRRRQLVDMRASETKRKQTASKAVHANIDQHIEFLDAQLGVSENLCNWTEVGDLPRRSRS